MEKKSFELTDEQALILGEFLKKRREELNYSTNYIENYTGINKADLSRIENGKKKKINPIYLKELARILELNQIELFNKVGYIDDEYLPNNKTLEIELINIPIYNTVEAGLDNKNYEDPIYFLPFPKSNGEIFGVKFNGDSMEKTILDGAILIVKKNVILEKGEIGVFLIKKGNSNEGLIKRVKHKNGIYILASDNKKYEDIEVKRENIITCGKVLKIRNELDKNVKDPLYKKIDKLTSEKRKLAEALLDALINSN